MKKKEVKEKSQAVETIETVVYLACVILACFLFIKFVAVRTVVNGTSMYDTLDHKDNLIVEKVSYYFRDPKRFEVVVFKKANSPEGKILIKRVIGLPGETVQIIDGYVYINGEKLTEDTYGSEVIMHAYTAEDPITLGPDEFFCMGDNRNNSKDSRSAEVGPVKKKEIVGHAWVRVFPFNKIGVVDHFE